MIDAILTTNQTDKMLYTAHGTQW